MAAAPHARAAPASAPPRLSSAEFPALDAAYEEYCRRRANGDEVDIAAFCARFPDIQHALKYLLDADEFLEARPELLVDAPTGWPEVGAAWEGYELLAELGRGAFARVYLARETALGRRLVAIKCTRYADHEAATLGRLAHPHVVPIYSIRDLPDRNLTVVCMPYLGHATLQHVCTALHGKERPPQLAREILEACRDHRLDADTPRSRLERAGYLDGVRWIASRIAGALAYLHAQGICHCDLKPSNILLEPDGSPRLLDFNLSAEASVPQAAVGGTLLYMAPEQLELLRDRKGAPLTPQVDVFALGVILYEWLTGSHPCAPLPVAANQLTLRRHLLRRHHAGDQAGAAPASGAPASAAPAGRTWPALAALEPSWAHLIERCLRPCPDERPTAAEVEQILARQLRPLPRMLRAVRRRPLRAAATAALVATVLSFGVYTAASQPPRAEAAYEQGKQAYRAGDYRQALAYFDEALARGGNHGADVLLARARAYQRLGNGNPEFFDLAIANYRQAYDQRPQGQCKAGMAYCLHRRHQLLGALDYYQQALAHGFVRPAVYHNLGCLHSEGSDLAKARGCFEKALELDDRFAPAHCELATLLTQEYLSARQGGPAVPPGNMPERLSRALDHLERGLPKIDAAPAMRAVQAARTFVRAIPYDPGYRDRVLAWLERAVAAGYAPTGLAIEPAFAPIRNEPRFVALTQRPPAGAAIAWVRIVDPLDD
ncbi:MAG: protein kinase [Gemmataceae bacterium]|nr:protein kinase [Gemmataceae bacterium]